MELEDDKLIKELNDEPLEHRVMLLNKLFESSVGEAELGYFIKDEMMFRIAMKTLNRMSENGGKL